jgi:hypothetical protein
MVIGGPPACIGSGMEAVHSPERSGNFCAEQTATAISAIKKTAVPLKKAIETHP